MFGVYGFQGLGFRGFSGVRVVRLCVMGLRFRVLEFRVFRV